MKFVCAVFFLLAVTTEAEEGENDLSAICKCAKPALRQMRRVLHTFSTKMLSADPPELDGVIQEITEIAYSECYLLIWYPVQFENDPACWKVCNTHSTQLLFIPLA